MKKHLFAMPLALLLLGSSDVMAQRFRAQLTKKQPMDPYQTQSHAFRIGVSSDKGKTRIVKAQGINFKPIIRLEKNGKPLKTVLPRGKEAELRFSSEGERWTVVVTSVEPGATGFFVLTMSESNGKQRRLRGPMLDIMGELTSKSQMIKSRRSDAYTLKLDKGMEYSIRMAGKEKSLKTSIRVEDAAGKVLRPLGAPAKIGDPSGRFFPPRSGTYRVIATTSAGAMSGAYRLTVDGRFVPR